jgi:hypothetical protein
MLMFLLGVVVGIWLTLLVLMIIHDEVSEKIVYRRNLQHLFIISSILGLIMFIIFFVPAIQIVILSVQPWLWIVLGVSLVILLIGILLHRYYHRPV